MGPNRGNQTNSMRTASLGKLDSWKEIAAYLKRDVRTVQRWEELEGLPVHRHFHQKVGSVYAYTAEIDSWWKNDHASSQHHETTGAHHGQTSVPRKIIHSLAVLPLENLSDDPEQEYFADGLTEALITDLAKLNALRVISRSSVMRFKGLRKPVQQIARKLDVDAVLEGTVQRGGERVRITAQLIHATSGTHLWAESYEQDVVDVLTLQAEVASAIATEVCIKVSPDDRARIRRVSTVVREAHEAYLKGRYLWNKRNVDALRKALDYFQKAIELDSRYALSYVGVADVYAVLGGVILGVMRPQEAMPKARAAATKALELDETLGEAHAVLAFISWMYDHDWGAAESGFQRALELNPSYSTAHQWYGVFQSHLGRPNEALAAIERARQLDPLSLQINSAVVQVLYFGRNYDRAIKHALETFDLDSTFSTAHLMLAVTYKQKGMLAEALAEGEKAAAFSSNSAASLACIGGCYAALGRTNDAKKIIEQLRELSKHQYVDPYVVGWVYGSLGDKEATMSQLELAYADRSSYLAAIRVDPGFDFLRSDQRYRDLLHRVTRPQ